MANSLIVCGGTFDHFHKGHEEFLKHALSLSRKLIVGLTSDKYVRRWKVDDRSWKQIESFERRKEAVLEFAKKEEVSDRIEIIEIDDLFGPTLSKDFPIDAIVVSQDTKKGAEYINRKRKELGLSSLKVFIAPNVYAEDQELISSARIRNGEIDRVGKLYVKSSRFKTDLMLPENLRKEFQKPFGELLLDINGLLKNKDNLVITVGDVTTKKFNTLNIKNQISVIDFKIAREKKFENIKELGFTGDEVVFKTNNPAGHITYSLFSKIENIFKSSFGKRIILEIEGEEDLAVLPLVLLAPLNTIIYYGQPHKGLVKITVSEKAKNKAHNLILRLKIV